MAKCKAESIRNEVMNGLVKDRSDLKDTKVKLQRIGEIVFKLAKAELMSKVQDNKIDKALAERLDTLRMSKIEKTAGTIEIETIKNDVPKTNKYEVDATKMVDRRGSGSTLTNHTGGAYGADGIWADMLRPHKVTNNHYQPVGTKSGNKRVQGLAKNGDRVINVTASEDAEGRKLNNKLGNATHGMNNRNLVQVYNADKVFAVAPIENGKVTGGTGSAVRMADALGKEVYVLDTTTVKWFQIKDGKATEIDYSPQIEGNFAAIGTRKLEQYPIQDKATGKWVKSEVLPNREAIIDEMKRVVDSSIKSKKRTLNIGGLSIQYETEAPEKMTTLASTNARTGRIRIQEGLTAVKVAKYLLNNEEVEGASKETKSKTRETRGIVVGLLNRKYGINIMEVLRAMKSNDQLLRSFLLLHEYRHTLQLKKSGSKEAFMEAYNEDPVKFELDADLFALKALKSEIGLIKDMTDDDFSLKKAGYTVVGTTKDTSNSVTTDSTPSEMTLQDTAIAEKPNQAQADSENKATSEKPTKVPQYIFDSSGNQLDLNGTKEEAISKLDKYKKEFTKAIENISSEPNFEAKAVKYWEDIFKKRLAEVQEDLDDVSNGVYDKEFKNTENIATDEDKFVVHDNITELKDNQIFVFGANAEGIHGKGSALQARKFGTANGEAVNSLSANGKTWGIVTKDSPYGSKVSKDTLINNINKLFKYASMPENANKEFLFTAIGTGLAGFTNEEVLEAIGDVTKYKNIKFPTQWKSISNNSEQNSSSIDEEAKAAGYSKKDNTFYRGTQEITRDMHFDIGFGRKERPDGEYSTLAKIRHILHKFYVLGSTDTYNEKELKDKLETIDEIQKLIDTNKLPDIGADKMNKLISGFKEVSNDIIEYNSTIIRPKTINEWNDYFDRFEDSTKRFRDLIMQLAKEYKMTPKPSNVVTVYTRSISDVRLKPTTATTKQKDDTMSSNIVDRTTNNITKEALECANGM